MNKKFDICEVYKKYKSLNCVKFDLNVEFDRN